jgi:hypothetical protein
LGPPVSGASHSDKGYYLPGIFVAVRNRAAVFKALMNGDWRDALLQLGGELMETLSSASFYETAAISDQTLRRASD